jgi:hypothetical protein
MERTGENFIVRRLPRDEEIMNEPQIEKNTENNSNEILEAVNNGSVSAALAIDADTQSSSSYAGLGAYVSAGQAIDADTQDIEKSMLQISPVVPVLILAAIIVIAYVINSTAGHPEWIWADCLGRAFGTGILVIISSAALAAILLRLLNDSCERISINIIAKTIIVPLVMSGFLWLCYAAYDAKKTAAEGREIHDSQVKLKKYMELGAEAKPVIDSVKFSRENGIKSLLKEKNGSLKVTGWSAAKIDDSTWLVQFKFSLDDQDKWVLYEYNSYLETIKSVMDEKNLSEKYLTTEGGAFNYKYEYLDWFGPIK